MKRTPSTFPSIQPDPPFSYHLVFRFHTETQNKHDLKLNFTPFVGGQAKALNLRKGDKIRIVL